MKKHFIYFISILIFSIVFSGVASAANIQVNNITGIQNAINTAANGDTLNLSAGTYKEHNIQVNKNLTITGPITTGNNPPTAVVDAQKQGRVFGIPSGVKVTLQYLLIQNGNSTTDTGSNSGGGIYNLGTLNIKNCTITKNTADIATANGWCYGGGIFNNGGTVILNNSNICLNTATGGEGSGGGGISNEFGGLVTLTNSNIYQNTAGYGGGIYNYDGVVTLTGSNVYNNYAYLGDGYGSGGGINNDVGTVTLTNSNVYNNIGECDGGGINNEGTMTLTNSNVYKNIAKDDGGGISNYGGTLTLINSKVYQNSATVSEDSFGGGIRNDATMILTSSNVYNNTAGSVGGGIHNNRNMTLTNSNIYNNTAGYGGGIRNFNSGTLTLTGSNVYNNIAKYDGGGISNYESTLILTNSNVFKNTANKDVSGDWYNGGGGINNYDSILILNGSNVYNNTAFNGGGIYSDDYGTPYVTLTNSNLFNNTATNGKGGGIYKNFGTMTLTFCTLIGNAALLGNDIYCGGDSVDATLNWWGSNQDPSGKVYGTVTVTPWLIFNLTANHSVIQIGGTSNISADLCHDSNGGYHNPGSGHVPDGIFVSFVTTKGTINSPISTVNGVANATLTSGTVLGVADVSAKANCQTVHTSVTINPDITSPLVISSDPVSNSVNVARNKVIKVTFSESIKAGNLWIELFNGSSKIPLTTSVSGSVLTISHAALLAPGTKYTLALHTGSVTDLAGNSLAGVARYFTTSTDAITPTITTSDPSNNVVNVAMDKAITVTFSESIKASTMWIELYNTIGTKTLIPITTSISGNVLTINHAALLTPGTKFTLALHTGSVTDLAGNSLAGVSRYFTTSTDAIAPTVKSIDPVNNAVNVARNKVITVTFNEPVKTGTMWIELYNSSGVQVPITKSISGSVLTISHAALLAPGTKYTLALHTGSVTDLAGNSLAGVSRVFTTGTT